jgi:hypothetical protein
MFYIYEINIGDYKYIGSTNYKRKRKSAHLRHLRNNNHANKKMQNVYNKHNEYDFRIIKELTDIDEMKMEEERYIKDYKKTYGKYCMNILMGYGGGSEWRSLLSEEELRAFDKKRTTMSPEKILKRNKKHSETIRNIPMEVRRGWYDDANKTRWNNIKNRKNYTPINVDIINPNGEVVSEIFHSEGDFFKRTKLEESSLRLLKRTGEKIIKKRLYWTRHEYPVGTILKLKTI